MLTDDGSIIHACLNGESEAFGILVDKYKAGIYAFAYSKLGDFQDAQDVTQEVFLESYKNLHSLRRWESFSFWLYRMASTLCKKFIQKRAKYPDSEHFEDLSSQSLANPSMNSYRENVLHESVHDALNSLPETYREVLMLHYFVGMDSKEIAKALGTSPTAIRMRISRAREQLKEEMLNMMGTAFNQQRLQASFTFRIVEAVKRIKIHPVSQMKGLPWGISLATGLLIAFLSINPTLSLFNHVGTPIFAPLPVESKVLKVGEIPVDVVKVSNISIISNLMGKGKGGEPKQPDENALFMAPQAEDGEWVRKADMPMENHALATCTIDNKIYAIGGAFRNPQNSFTSIATVYEYDPIKDTWTKKADMPTSRDSLGVGVVNGKIYAIGGETLVGGGSATSAVEEYDLKLDKWAKKASMPTARCGASTVVVNGKIYVIAGMTGVNEKNQALPNVEEYDPIKDIWTKKADMPKAKAGIAGSAFNGKIYIFGGASDWLNGPSLSTVEEYDPMTDTWIEKSEMPKALMDSSATTANNKIYIFGGDFFIGEAWGVLSSVYEYDPINDKWATKPDMPVAKTLLSTSLANGRIYVIGGAKLDPVSVPLSSVEEYTPEGWKEAVSLQGKLPKPWGTLKAK
jgi:RNA polymerase sigma factor (sigma-70 family)